MRIICFHRVLTFTTPNAHICSREFLNNFKSTNQARHLGTPSRQSHFRAARKELGRVVFRQLRWRTRGRQNDRTFGPRRRRERRYGWSGNSQMLHPLRQGIHPRHLLQLDGVHCAVAAGQ